MKVLILDDETARAEAWRESLKGLGIQSEVPDVEGVAELIEGLQMHRLSAREGKFQNFVAFDNVDLLIVDYDLLGLRGHGWTTGAEIAYAARLLSSVGPIVIVNQYGTNAFDLTMRRAAVSHADLDVGSAQIVNAGLYASSEFSGFRPWFWPNLADEAERLDAFSDFAQKHLDDAVAPTIGFDLRDPTASNFLSREVCAPIDLDSEITFRKLAVAARSGGLSAVLEKDHALLASLPDEIVARISASIISRWIDRYVVPNQDVLMDFPHAIAAAPWLMRGHQSLEGWNAFGLRSQSRYAVDVSAKRVELPFLSSRDVYWRNSILAMDRPDDFSMADVPDFVFCEDVSRFEPREKAKEFSANLESYLSGRWVRADDNHVIYEPQAYLLE